MNNYKCSETIAQKGGKIVRKVSIKKGRGYKSVTTYRKGKRVSTVRKPLHKDHIEKIKMRKFIPGLFSDCVNCKTKKKRGGDIIQQSNTDRRNKLSELQSLIQQNQRNTEIYNQINDRLDEIEDISDQESLSHNDEYNRLNEQLVQLQQRDYELQERFEQLRAEYIRDYGNIPTQRQ